jgi:hypothetical protein
MIELSYRRHRFPPVVIQHAVWVYLRFTLSYRDVEDLLAERGLDISYETVRSWALKFGPAIWLSGAPGVGAVVMTGDGINRLRVCSSAQRPRVTR